MEGNLFSAFTSPRTCQTPEKLTSDPISTMPLPSTKFFPKVWGSTVVGTPKLFLDPMNTTARLGLWDLLGSLPSTAHLCPTNHYHHPWHSSPTHLPPPS